MKIKSDSQGLGREVNPEKPYYGMDHRQWNGAYTKFEQTVKSYPVIDQKGNSVPGYEGEAELHKQYLCTSSPAHKYWSNCSDEDYEYFIDEGYQTRVVYRVILPQVEEEKQGLKTLIETNKAIAEFMGATKTGGSTIAKDGSFTDQYEVVIDPNSSYKTTQHYYDKETNVWTSPKSLQYHTSWDWLMPVVERITDKVSGCIITIDTAYGYNMCKITNNMWLLIEVYADTKEIDTAILATYHAVVEFISTPPEPPTL